MAAHYPWFALYVKPRHEKHISVALRGRGYEEFVPLYQRRTPSRTSELPLFPGYVFCRFDAQKRLPIATVPGVLSIVASGGAPVAVPDHEIASLKKVVGSGLRRQPWPNLASGQKVVIRAGPLQGVEGVYVGSRNSCRLVVSVSLLRRSVVVEIDEGWIAAS